jgi:endonuclease YncB( thermonuclease family)
MTIIYNKLSEYLTVFNKTSFLVKTLLMITFIFCTAYAEVAVVKDGDTIKLGSRSIRFYGIDAPENKQKCYHLDGTSWDCGLEATNLLKELISNKNVECILQSIDLYKREVAICYADKVELNKLMVEKGYAIAYKQYSKKYVSDEILAKKHFIGIWNSSFMEPEQWRRYIKFKAKQEKAIRNNSK